MLWIPDVYSGSRIRNFFHPGSRVKKISDPDQHPDPQSKRSRIQISIRIKDFKYFKPKKFSKLWEIWSGMFIPNRHLYFLPIRDPGSRGKRDTGSRSSILGWIPIRIQYESGSRGFDDQNLENLQLKKQILIKNFSLPIPRPLYRTP